MNLIKSFLYYEQSLTLKKFIRVKVNVLKRIISGDKTALLEAKLSVVSIFILENVLSISVYYWTVIDENENILLEYSATGRRSSHPGVHAKLYEVFLNKYITHVLTLIELRF